MPVRKFRSVEEMNQPVRGIDDLEAAGRRPSAAR